MQNALSGTITVLCTNDKHNCASFKNGVVYCDGSVIGYYELINGGAACSVTAEKGEYEVGRLLSDNSANTRYSITLSRDGAAKKYYDDEGRYPIVSYPAIEEVALATYFGVGAIEDAKTHEKIAEFTGNCIEAAAAFVALAYRLLPDTRYHAFYKFDKFF